MLANDVKYHLNCWVKVQRKVASSSSVEVQEIDDLSRVLADIEIVNTVDYLLHEANTIIDLNSLNITYKNLLRNETEYQNYKQFLKQLVEENVLEIVFSRPPARNQSERICSSNVCGEAVNTYTNSSDDYNTIFEAAKLIRRQLLLKQDIWIFTEYFTGFSNSQQLQLLLHWTKKCDIDTSSKKLQEIGKSVNI